MHKEIKSVNIWECGYKSKCTFLFTFEDLIEYIETNNLPFTFFLYDTHYPNTYSTSLIDQTADKLNIKLTYTNEEHPITILNDYKQQIFIHKSFFKNNLNKFKEYYKPQILKEIKSNSHTIFIPDYLIDDELIDFIISNNKYINKTIFFTYVSNVLLTEDQIKKLKDTNLTIIHHSNSISSKKIIPEDIDIKELDYLKYTTANTVIIIKPIPETNYDERKYLENLNRIFNTLSTHNKTYNIKIRVTNRELIKQTNLLSYPSINIIIDTDHYNYTKEEYLKEEEFLDKLILHIKESNLSPYEKYLAVYNIVKNFKTYKENNDNKIESRALRHILYNDFMVCVGFSKLLKILLDKVGIPCSILSVDADTSYDKGYTKEDLPTSLEGHSRNIIKIDDDKYNIHGIFLADATWDNNIKKDYYFYSTLTFDRIKESKRLETLTPEDLLLDFHNFQEFTVKLNFYIQKLINRNKKKILYQAKVLHAYSEIYKKIMILLMQLDYPKYLELYNKYDKKIKTTPSFSKQETIYSDFLTEYANYIIPLTNKKIDDRKLLSAVYNLEASINNYPQDELTEILEQIQYDRKQIETKIFPYIYNPNNPKQNFLKRRKNR